MNYNELAKTIHEQNKAVGWWDDPDRCILTCMQLVNTEVAEATEGFRKNLMDDHLPHRKMEEVELADALIRTLDIGGRLNLTYKPIGTEFPCQAITNGAMHLAITTSVCIWSSAYIYGTVSESEAEYSNVISCIEYVAKKLGYDLEGAVMEKLEYNKHRLDHKRSERAKDGGKKI